MLAGMRVPNDDVRELAGLVDEPTATTLQNALDREVVILARRSTTASGSSVPSTTRPTDSPSSVACCSASTRGAWRKGSWTADSCLAACKSVAKASAPTIGGGGST